MTISSEGLVRRNAAFAATAASAAGFPGQLAGFFEIPAGELDSKAAGDPATRE